MQEDPRVLFGRKLAKLRKQKGWSQEKLSLESGVARSYLGEHVIPYVYGKLASLGVKTIPVIGYDRWDSTQYRVAMQQLEV